jgi:uncharacterized protein YraI
MNKHLAVAHLALAVALLVLLIASCAAPSGPEPGPEATGPVAEKTTAIIDLLDKPVPTSSAPARPTVGPRLKPETGAIVVQLLPTPTRRSGEPTHTGVVEGAIADLRSGPSEQSDILGYLVQGDSFQVIAASADGKWLHICCPIDADSSIWISASLVKLETVAAGATVTSTVTVTATPAAVAQGQGTVNADAINVRGGPGVNYPVVGRARAGSTVDLFGRNEAGDWVRICCPVNQRTESWISVRFLDLEPVVQDVAALPLAPIPPTPQAPVGGGPGAQSAASLAAAPAAGLPGPGNFGAPASVNPLTGLPLAGDRAGQRPVIVCINNDYAARPQLGMGQADVVYEYLMEGYGITRFSAIFYGESAPQIGPVRSARLINYYMGGLYHAGTICSGASDPVRYLLKHQAPFPYMDIDLDDPSQTRYSVSIGRDYRTRMRTSSDGARRWLADWGMEQPASIRGFTFGALPGGGAPAANIRIPYPGGSGSAYHYDPGSGRYRRSMGGVAHVDGNTGAQLAPENVIVQYVIHEATDIVEDSLGSTSIRLNLFGSGQAIVFRDGQAFAGTWRSESRGDTPRFYDQGGAEIPLKPGKTWISIVPGTYTISYQ